MITETSTNYSERRVDLCLFPKLLLPLVPVDMEVSASPMSIAGAAKAAQGYLRVLFTTQGEVAGDPECGTNFFSRITSPSVRYPSDVEQIFLIESSKAVDFWNKSSIGVRPADEQIKTVSLVDLEIGRQGVSISVDLATRSETNITFLLPVNWSK